MTPKRTKIQIPGAVRNIVVVRLYGLGNFILALPLIDALPKQYPKARITLLVDPRCEKIARMAKPRRRIVTIGDDFDADHWFAGEKPDLTLFTYPCAEAGIVKSATQYSGQCVTHSVGANTGIASYELNADPIRHEVNLNLDLLRALGRKIDLSHPMIKVPSKGLSEAGRIIREMDIPKDYIAFHPGCYGDLAVKRWPPDYYGKLADLLHDDGFGVILVGGSDEHELATPIIESTTVPIVDIIGKTTLPQVAGLLQHARFMVANDTGLMHLAAAVGTPVVGIYGPTSQLKNTPLIADHRIVRRPVSCSPCYQPGKPFAPLRAWCLEMTTPDMVHQACKKLLQEKPYRNKARQRPFVSVIIPTYNGKKRIGRLLESLGRQTYPQGKFEVIVVDNNSTDGTKHEIQKYPHIRYEFYAERQTSYAARNHGILQAKGEILAFTDDDCVADPNWIANAVQWFEHPDVGGVAGKVIGAQSDNDIARWQSRRGFLDLHPDIESSKRPSIVTANVFYRRNVFDQVKPFQETMISSGDQEMAWRMVRDSHYIFRAAEDAVIHHHHRETLKSLTKTNFRYGFGHVDLDMRFPFDNKPPFERISDAAQSWMSLIRQGFEFATKGYAPSAISGLRDERPEEFFKRCGSISGGYIFTAENTDDSPILSAAIKNGIKIVRLPLPPSVEYLDAAIRPISSNDSPGLFLYAAGQHTRRLMDRPDFKMLSAQGIIDDKAAPDQMMGQLPVVTLNEALRRGCRTILISTDAFEHILLKKLNYLEKQGVGILGFYNEEAFERFARHEAGALADMPTESKALYISQSRLSDPLTWALAKGAGIQIRLDEKSNSRYSDAFLDWIITVAKRAGRIAGSIRYGHLYV